MTSKSDKRRSRKPASRKPRRSRRAAPAPVSEARDASAALTQEVRSILEAFRLEDVVSHLLRRAHFALWLVISLALAAVFALSLPGRKSSIPNNPGLNWGAFR